MSLQFDQTSRERWHFSKISAQRVKELSEALKLDPILAKLLLARNLANHSLTETQHFISPPESLITDFDKVTSKEDLEKATQRIAKAINEQERIVVNGDPDADGITGTVVLVSSLRLLGGIVHYDFPTRSKEGHGLQPRIIDEAKQAGATLIITSDCGSKDVESTRYANSQNIDVIICDHHILGRELPPALAMVNPYRVEGPNLEKKLSGAGVTFKLVLALFATMNREMPSDFRDYLLAIASLGTISDRMSFLNPMNRIMVKHGVDALNQTKMEGLKALKDVSSNGLEQLRSNDISRTIVPRLNAPGRIGDRSEGIPDSRIVVDLLLLGTGKRNAQKATEVLEEFNAVYEMGQKNKAKVNSGAFDDAAIVEDINEKRKFLTSKIEDEIDDLIKQQVNPQEDRVIVIQGKNWNPGVIGIDTDRLKDRFLRPAVIVTEYTGSEYLRGSVRSIPTINMYSIVDEVSERFEKEFNRSLFQTEVETLLGKRIVNAFGGHAQACGFTLHKKDFQVFVTYLREAMSLLPIEQFNYSYEILDTLRFHEISAKLVQKLDSLTPFGQEFEYPVFFMKKCTLGRARAFGNKYQEARTPHVEFTVFDSTQPESPNQERRLSAVGFGLWEKYSKLKAQDPNQSFDIIFMVESFKKRIRKRPIQKIRLNVLDIRVSE